MSSKSDSRGIDTADDEVRSVSAKTNVYCQACVYISLFFSLQTQYIRKELHSYRVSSDNSRLFLLYSIERIYI